MADPGTALVLGANGQDGTFLCRRLLDRGFHVLGVGRDVACRHVEPHLSFAYRQLDLRDLRSLEDLLEEVSPARIFHVAAVHASSASNAYETVFADMLDVNVKTVHVALEYLRKRNPIARLFYASSAKVFGAPLPSYIDESTPRRGSCLYSITKNAAGDLIGYYRRVHGALANVVFLFNHESVLRPRDFFIPKLARSIAAALRGTGEVAEFFTLDFWCDWGSADEYMDLVIDLIEGAPGEDVVLATGRCVHAATLAEQLFSAQGLVASAHLRVSEVVAARAPSEPYHVDLKKLESLVGRRPLVDIECLVDRLVARELGGADSQLRPVRESPEASASKSSK